MNVAGTGSVSNRLSWTLLTLAFVVVLNFFLFRILPGDPARAVRDPRLSQETIEAIRVRFGLEQPLFNCIEQLNPLHLGSCTVNPLQTQFGRYLVNLLHGDLGISFHSQRPVAEILAERLVNTVLLIGAGQLLALVLGILLGLLAAWKAGTALDFGTLLGSLVAWSLPTFWVGMMLLFWGSSQLGLPVAGMQTPAAGYTTLWQHWLDIGRHMLLPTLTFTLVYAAEYALFMRSTLLAVFAEDYILTAKAKGLSHWQIITRHALPNAWLPTITIVALNLGFTVAGAIQIETVFSWPGLGLAVVEAVARQDYPVLQGAFLLLAVSVILANLAADLLYGWLDPRIRTA